MGTLRRGCGGGLTSDKGCVSHGGCRLLGKRVTWRQCVQSFDPFLFKSSTVETTTQLFSSMKPKRHVDFRLFKKREKMKSIKHKLG